MLWAFERILRDPQKVIDEQREHDAARARAKETDDDPPTLKCKACGYEGPERYCPKCLADTMRKIKR